MRKVYLGLLSIGCIGLLAACNGIDGNDYVIKLGGSVVTDEFKQANYNQNESYLETGYKALKYDTSGYTVIDFDTMVDGYVVVQNTTTLKYGIYSLYGNKLLLDTRFSSPSDFTIYADSDSGAYYYGYNENNEFGLCVKYQDPTSSKYNFVDGVGNVLYTSDGDFNVYEFSYNTVTEEDPTTGEDVLIPYSRLYLYDNELDDPYVTIYHKYDSAGKATKVKDYSSLFSGGSKTQPGEVFLDEDSTHYYTEYGLDRYVRVFTNRLDGTTGIYNSTIQSRVVQICEKDGTVAKTITVEKDHSLYLVGKLIVDQLVTSEYLTNYSVQTSIYNVETLEGGAKDIPASIESIKALNPAKAGDPVYYQVQLREIKADKTAGAQRVLIMDEKGEFHDDITHANFVDWLRLSNGYFYDVESKVLYDDKFIPVFNATDFDFHRDGEVFDNEENLTYIVNNEGKLVFDSKLYSDIDYCYNGYYEAYKGEQKVLLDAISATATELKVNEGETKYTSDLLDDSGKLLLHYEATISGTAYTSCKMTAKPFGGNVIINIDSLSGFGFESTHTHKGRYVMDNNFILCRVTYYDAAFNPTGIEYYLVYDNLFNVTTL